jgi:hypothetical protein
MLTGAKVPMQVVAGGTTVQAKGIGAPPMPWPHVGPVAVVHADVFAVLNGFAASPGRTEM